MYKSDNKQLRYQTEVTVKGFLANISWMAGRICMIELVLESAHWTISDDI